MSTTPFHADGNGKSPQGNGIVHTGNGAHANGNGAHANGNGAYYPPSSGGLWPRLWDWTDKPDSAALHGLFSGAIWFVLVTSFGLIMSNELVQAEIFHGIPWLTFSRLRPAHVNMALFGFLSTAFFGAWYFIVPRLCRTPLRTNRTANLLLLLWNITVTVATISLLAGASVGKEYSEYPWFISYPVELLLILNIGIIFSTIAARREPKMYVSLWYIGGSTVWIAFLYAIGHPLWLPFTTYETLPNHMFHVIWNPFQQTIPASLAASGQTIINYRWQESIIGLDDAVWNWFYGHNVFGLYITTGGIAIAYYLVPKITKRPLYSHTMSLIGFWSIALLYTETGQHHLLQAPIPNWLKVIAVIGSIALIIPVFTFNTNLFMTMRGAWGMMLQNIPLRFIMTGAFFYLAASFQGSVQALMSVNRFVHFSQWTIAHAHLALLGAFGFIACGATLYMVPQIKRRPLWSVNLADAQYWLMLLGINGYFWSITAAGLAQASAWVSLGDQVVRAYPIVKPYFALRSVFGGMIWIGVIMQAINIIQTIRVPALSVADRRRMVLAEVQQPELPPVEIQEGEFAVD
jgi:cbb3-type cytochrome c oxidase subunit I